MFKFLQNKDLGNPLRNKSLRINDLTKPSLQFRNVLALRNVSGQLLTNTCDEASGAKWLIFDQ
jgi:hypothetical protein